MNITADQFAAEYAAASAAWGGIFASAETRYALPAGLLYAVGSRETDLNPRFTTGDRGDPLPDGNGHGLFQLDDRWHAIPQGFDTDVAQQADVAARMLRDLLDTSGGDLHAALNRYNAGRPDDASTTGGDYGPDVLERLAFIQTLTAAPSGGSMSVVEPPITIRASDSAGIGGLNGTITRFVVHDEEYPVSASSAEAVARDFRDRVPPHYGAAHYVFDEDSEQHCVPENLEAYHAPPNHGSIGGENNGYASFTREQWLSRTVGTWKTLCRCAARAAATCVRYDLPVVWLSPADLRAGRKGITSHWNVTRAFGMSTHTDPGLWFPVPEFLRLVAAAKAILASGASIAAFQRSVGLPADGIAGHDTGIKLGDALFAGIPDPSKPPAPVEVDEMSAMFNGDVKQFQAAVAAALTDPTVLDKVAGVVWGYQLESTVNGKPYAAGTHLRYIDGAAYALVHPKSGTPTPPKARSVTPEGLETYAALHADEVGAAA